MKVLLRPTLAFALSAAVISTAAPAVANPAPLYGAVVVYGDPTDADTPSGAAFSASTQADVVDLAVERCKAHTPVDAWSHCAPGQWIATGQYLLVAAVCDVRGTRGGSRRKLEFLKDGVTATDEQIREAVQRDVAPATIADGGCRKAAVFDRARPQDTNVPELQTARSVAKDKPR